MVAFTERARLAERLIEATCRKQCRKQGIGPHQLTIHADRGAPMRSKLVAELFADLTISASHSRPRVSNDNPFSEAQFRTLKYRPEFPDRFGSLEHARTISHDLLTWYNDAHHHSGLSYLTPADVHHGRAPAILDRRHHTRLAAYPAHPERFVSGPPRPETLPTAVWFNPPSPPPGCPRDDRHAGQPAAWGDRRAIRDPSGSLDRARRERGVATLNTESGCLKRIDTARCGNVP